MKKHNNNHKLTINDMIYSLDKLYPEIKFKPVDIIQTIISLHYGILINILIIIPDLVATIPNTNINSPKIDSSKYKK